MKSRLFLSLYLSLFLAALIAVGTASAQEIVVEKRVEQENVGVGSLLAVHITVLNLGESVERVVVQEVVVDAEPFSPDELIVPQAPVGFIGVRLPYYEWKLTIAPGGSEEILYIIRPLTPGEYVIAPTRAYAYGRQFLSEPVTIGIVCNANSVCESEFSENYLNCPSDCSSGSEDGVCNLIADGVCDPDCADGADSDCHLFEESVDADSIGEVSKSMVKFPLPLVMLVLIVLLPVSGLFIVGIGRNFKK